MQPQTLNFLIFESVITLGNLEKYQCPQSSKMVLLTLIWDYKHLKKKSKDTTLKKSPILPGTEVTR